MKLKALAKRTAAAALTLAAVALAAAPVLAAPAVDVSPNNAVADHAGILSDDTINYINSVSAELSDACGAQIGVYTLDELLGNTTMEGYAYDVFNEWGLGSADKDNGVLLLLAPYEADGGDYFIMRGAGLESQLSISTLSTMTDEYLEPSWAQGNYDAGTRKTVEALTKRLCSIYGVSLDDGYTTTTTRTGRSNITAFILILFAVILILALLRPRRRRRPRTCRPRRPRRRMVVVTAARAMAAVPVPAGLAALARHVPTSPAPAAPVRRVPFRRRFIPRQRRRPQQPSLRRQPFGQLPRRRRHHPRRRCGTPPLKRKKRVLCLNLQSSRGQAPALGRSLHGSCPHAGITCCWWRAAPTGWRHCPTS